MAHKDQKTKDEVKLAVGHSDNIRENVRNIVIEALGEHHLDRENVKKTMKAVLEGAIEGAPEGSKELASAMKKTVEGLDEAMANAAQASRLAIEEATSRVDEFSDLDLKRAIDDLRGLEELFLETLGDLAKAGHKTAGSALHDIITHAKRGNTKIGKSVSESLQALHSPLSRAERPHLKDVEKVARTGAASLAAIASGILAGMADSLTPQKQSDDNNSQKNDS